MEKEDQDGLHISVIFILVFLQQLFRFSEATFMLLFVIYMFFFHFKLMKRGIRSWDVLFLTGSLVYILFFLY